MAGGHFILASGGMLSQRIRAGRTRRAEISGRIPGEPIRTAVRLMIWLNCEPIKAPIRLMTSNWQQSDWPEFRFDLSGVAAHLGGIG
jgi:hypothetical protein